MVSRQSFIIIYLDLLIIVHERFRLLKAKTNVAFLFEQDKEKSQQIEQGSQKLAQVLKD